MERDIDARMKRTRERPLPAGRMSPRDALLFGLLFSLAGIAILGLFTNLRAAFLAFATIAIYIVVYTPMKRMSSLNTLVGAVPGALPPLIGWVAARGSYSLEGGLLFATLFFWQMPHFLAIAWMFRDDYKAGGCLMLTDSDPDGSMTGRQALLYSICLIVVSLLPGFLGFNSPLYFYGALLLGLAFSAFAAIFLRRRDRDSARNLFFASIIYLPLLLGLLVATIR
jgi:protoheme IX farnesyltransferase